jgi:hypothetical protein
VRLVLSENWTMTGGRADLPTANPLGKVKPEHMQTLKTTMAAAGRDIAIQQSPRDLLSGSLLTTVLG